MSKNKKQDAKEELLDALRSLNINWVEKFIKKLEKPQTNLPQGENADTETCILLLYISFLIFENNKAVLMKKGKLLKEIIGNYAAKVPFSHFDFVNDKFYELINMKKKSPADTPHLEKK